MRAVAAAALAFTIGLAGVVPMAHAHEGSALTSDVGGLTSTGQDAIADLRTCLASEDVLNVYYLIDASASLLTTDPENVRARVLSNSLEQLGSIGEATEVYWAAGFFGSEFYPSVGWTQWDREAGATLESRVVPPSPGAWTNWPAGLDGARQLLSSQQSQQPGCQMLVWLTDGELDIGPPNGPDPTDSEALNDLCGQILDPAGPRPAVPNGGVFNSFRQSGVIVVGALMSLAAPSYVAPQMQALVEGSNDDGDTCGQSPLPPGYVNGAFIEARSPDDLAQVFLQLAAQVGGGYPLGINEDGTFLIDEGVSRFRIVLPGDWSLTAPGSTQPLTPSSSEPWLAVEPGALEVAVDRPELSGEWRLEASGAAALFLYSDLSIRFDETNQVEVGPEGASAGVFRASMQRDGEQVGLGEYQEGGFSASLIGTDGTKTSLPGWTIDWATGEITIPVPAEVTTAEVLIEASIDPLVTAGNGLELAPVTTQQRVQTILPANFPTISSPRVQLSALEGAGGTATGSIEVEGPKAGDEPGSVCVVELPLVQSDATDRAGTWVWAVELDGGADECQPVAPGSTVSLVVSAQNSVAADGAIRATLPVTLKAADGSEIVQQVTLEFTSTHPTNPWAISLIALVLLVLGVLLPLLALWLMSWFTTRLESDASVQRATFSAEVAASGVDFLDAPASDTALSERFRYRGAAHNARSLDDPDLGTLRAVVPWFPLRAPRYVVVPRGDSVILMARSSARSGGAAERRPDGSVWFSQLPLDAFWAIVTSRAALLRSKPGEAVSAKVVIYHRPDASGPGQYRTRMAEISNETAPAETAARLRDSLADPLQKSPPPSRDQPGSSSSADGHAGAAPRSAGTPRPQPGDGSIPPRSTPPPRPNSDPPPRGGVPPRPGSASPPPRGGTPPRPGNR